MDPRLRLDISWSDLIAGLTPGVADARASIAAHWPRREAVTFLSVRTAFDALLQALSVAPGDEIVMSAVNIESMAEVARAHGVRLRPVDIELETLAPASEAVRAAIGPRTRAVLIAHLYGARVDLSRYVGVKQAGVLLIEDCAQGWGGGYRGAADADVSFFSFGPIKRRTALGGGVAVFADAALATRCAAIETGYTPMSESWFVRRLAKFAGLKLASTSWLYGLVMQAVQMATGDAERAIGAAARGFPPGDLIRRLRFRPPQRMLRLLATRLRQREDDSTRIVAAREVMAALDPSATLLGRAAPSNHYWLAPILLADPAAAALALRAEGFDATRGATSLRAIEEPGHAAPNARRLIDHVLYLPPPWHMSASRRRKLAASAARFAPLTTAAAALEFAE